jgi:hypothetical protein
MDWEDEPVMSDGDGQTAAEVGSREAPNRLQTGREVAVRVAVRHVSQDGFVLVSQPPAWLPVGDVRPWPDAEAVAVVRELATRITPEKLEKLAGWFDLVDRLLDRIRVVAHDGEGYDLREKLSRSSEIQDDLRSWMPLVEALARLAGPTELEAGEGVPDPTG